PPLSIHLDFRCPANDSLMPSGLIAAADVSRLREVLGSARSRPLTWEGTPVAHAWMPGARRIRADTDGGPLNGGAPRAVWLTLGTAPCTVSIQSAAQRLVGERRPCHLVWDPVTGDIAQLISVLRAGRALGAADHLDWAPGRIRVDPENVNAQGRVCVQIGVLSHPDDPFTEG